MTSKTHSITKTRLTPKQEAFCIEYLIDLNGTQAAIRANYSEKTARQLGSQLLANINIQHKIQKLNGQRMVETKIDANSVLDILNKLANSNVGEMLDDDGVFLPIKKMPLHVQKSIQSFEIEETHEKDDNGEILVTTKTIKIKLWSKDKSVENLGKHLKLFTEKVDISNSDGSLAPQIIINLPSNGRENVIEI